MKAAQTTLSKTLDGVLQYTVPLFQRPYSWREPQWKDLWNDLLETTRSSETQRHFFGALVTKSGDLPGSNLSRKLLIDGQQRLTTVFVLLASFRDMSNRRGDTDFVGDIEHENLFNSRRQNEEYWKLLPTQGDREAFAAVMRGLDEEGKTVDGASWASHALGQCSLFFQKRLKAADTPALDELRTALLSRFEVVEVLLEGDDDPYRIFESLNARGQKLSQADLIRNYFLMRVPSSDQERVYQTVWKPMEDALGENLSPFMRHFLSKDGELINQNNVYSRLRALLPNYEPQTKSKPMAET